MPRASRYLVEGYTYHLTHRCHDKRFLLKFSQERQDYREWLRIASKRYRVPIYGYCIIDINRLLQILNLNSHEELSHLHNERIRREIKLKNIARVPHWTEALAVGSKDFVTNARSQYQHRQSFIETDIETDHQQNTWILREASAAYMPDFNRKSAL